MSRLQGGSELDFSIKNHQYSSLAQSVERRTVNSNAVRSMGQYEVSFLSKQIRQKAPVVSGAFVRIFFVFR